jgi:hypothetical protein
MAKTGSVVAVAVEAPMAMDAKRVQILSAMANATVEELAVPE